MSFIKNSVLTLASVSFLAVASFAQDLDQLMKESETPQKEYVKATFKGTRVINGHSIESPGKGVLQIMFLHRFGPLNDPLYTYLGLDQATIRLGADYGITDRLAVGFGRSSTQKAYDLYVKYRIITQSTGDKAFPFSISALAATAINTQRWINDGLPRVTEHRLYYTGQLIIARKFGERFSLQLMPTIVHRNLTESPDQKNTILSVGIATRVKLSKRFALTGEYYYTPQSMLGNGFYTPVAFGFDIETGGHVFQIHITNTTGMIEHQFIGMTQQDFFSGPIALRLGFNFSRVFTLYRKKIAEP